MGAVKTIRVAVTGGRDHRISRLEREEFVLALSRYKREKALTHAPTILLIIHGDCRGVDRQAADIATQCGHVTVPVPAPWEPLKKLLGEDDPRWKAAGHIRNWQLISGADLLIAFPGGSGTADCVRQAEAAGVPVLRIESDAPRPD